jgi:phosphoglycerate-specific signal transduction histidine kinase
VKAEYDRACALRGAFETEHRLLLPYGKTRWVIMRGRCLKDEHGNILETIGVTLDVSAQKQAALQLQVQREEMAHRNRVALMGEMTASFAHEINQPLTAISNKASAARRFLDRGNIDPVLLRELLEEIAADSQRAGEVMRGIRSLVRKETSEQTLLNLNAIISDTVRLVSSDVLNRESVVTTELDPSVPGVKGTLVQIQQVLLNLIINALDAMEALPPAERRVVVSTRSDKGDVAEVTVRNKKEWAWVSPLFDQLLRLTAARLVERMPPIAARAWLFAFLPRVEKCKKAKRRHERISRRAIE